MWTANVRLNMYGAGMPKEMREVILPEVGIEFAYALGTGLSKGMPKPAEFKQGEPGGFTDYFGASARMGAITQGTQLALMGLDASGAMGNPEEGGGLFHGTNAAAAVVGFLGMWFARPLSGNGYGSGTAANTIFADGSPFFDGRAGNYDLYDKNYLWTRQRFYATHTSFATAFGYAFAREMKWATYKLEKSDAFDLKAPTTASAKKGPISSVNFGLNILPNGGSISAEGTF